MDDPDYDSLGPAMRKLPPMQRRYVIALLDGTGRPADAAREAGYSASTPGNLVAAGWRLSHTDTIQAAIQEEARKRIGAGQISAVKVVTAVMEDSQTPPKDRLTAAKMLLDRGGLHTINEAKVEVTHSFNDRENAQKLRNMLGADAEAVLAKLGYIDAEFTDVTPAAALPAPAVSVPALTPAQIMAIQLCEGTYNG